MGVELESFVRTRTLARPLAGKLGVEPGPRSKKPEAGPDVVREVGAPAWACGQRLACLVGAGPDRWFGESGGGARITTRRGGWLRLLTGTEGTESEYWMGSWRPGQLSEARVWRE